MALQGMTAAEGGIGGGAYCWDAASGLSGAGMYRFNILLFGSVCVVGAAFAFLNTLTGPRFIPPAAGRSAVRADVVVSPVGAPIESPSPGEAQSPLDEYQNSLVAAEQYLRSVDGYSATFVRQVRKDDELLDLEEISVKIRHEPFSVYMNWADGQEVLYVEGENDGRLLAKRSTGFFRRTIRLGPTSRLAMRTSRYPIYDLGMLNLVVRARDALAACPSFDGIHCEVESTDLDGKPVRKFTITVDSPEVLDIYSRCVICFSEDDPMLVWISNYGWNEDGESGDLLEYYYYRDVQVDPGLTDLDFDAENEAYAF